MDTGAKSMTIEQVKNAFKNRSDSILRNYNPFPDNFEDGVHQNIDMFVGLKPVLSFDVGPPYRLQVYAPELVQVMKNKGENPIDSVIYLLARQLDKEIFRPIHIVEILDSIDEIDCIKEDEIINTIGLELPARRPKQGFSIFDMF